MYKILRLIQLDVEYIAQDLFHDIINMIETIKEHG